MTRFLFFQILILAGQCLLAQSRPNVLFLMTDEHSPKVLGCYGNELIQTPNLDVLAESGTMFTNAYCQNPVCVPSRASLISGRVPSFIGIKRNSDSIHQEITLPTLFKDAGYEVEWYGKEHWGNSNEALGFGNGNRQLFKSLKSIPEYNEIISFRDEVGRLPHDAETYEFSEENDYESLVASEAVEYLKNRDASKTFFLGVSFRKPHFPFICNYRYYDLYMEDIDLPAITQEMKDDWSITEKQESDKWKFEEISPEQIMKARAIYFGMVSYIDEQFGRIIRELKEQGLYDNTIIVYTSDHGEMNGEHGLWYKNSFYDPSVSVPFIWSYPGRIKEGQISNDPVMILDILPTLCDLCSLEKPGEMDGNSLAGQLICGAEEEGRAAFSESYRSKSYGYMIRKGPWKYCWFALEKGRLFNMDEDPQELENLIDDAGHQATIDILHAQLEQFYKKNLD